MYLYEEQVFIFRLRTQCIGKFITLYLCQRQQGTLYLFVCLA